MTCIILIQEIKYILKCSYKLFGIPVKSLTELQSKILKIQLSNPLFLELIVFKFKNTLSAFLQSI